jgi:hypothetical protein
VVVLRESASGLKLKLSGAGMWGLLRVEERGAGFKGEMMAGPGPIMESGVGGPVVVTDGAEVGPPKVELGLRFWLGAVGPKSKLKPALASGLTAGRYGSGSGVRAGVGGLMSRRGGGWQSCGVLDRWGELKVLLSAVPGYGELMLPPVVDAVSDRPGRETGVDRPLNRLYSSRAGRRVLKAAAGGPPLLGVDIP